MIRSIQLYEIFHFHLTVEMHIRSIATKVVAIPFEKSGHIRHMLTIKYHVLVNDTFIAICFKICFQNTGRSGVPDVQINFQPQFARKNNIGKKPMRTHVLYIVYQQGIYVTNNIGW